MRNVGKLGRRQFLRGTGGFTLALPVLPSLLSSRARAQARTQKRFVAIATSHGGVPASTMFPPDAVADRRQQLFPGHFAHEGTLPYAVNGQNASISGTLTAPASELTADLVRKMNVVRGLGIMRYMGHHTGGHLGNLGRSDQNAGDLVPTVDQLMAWSSGFYPDLGGVVQRSIHVDSKKRTSASLSFGWSDPVNARGAIEAIPTEGSSLALFDRLFGGLDVGAGGGEDRTPVVDRVLEHYRGMTSGRFGDAQRLSAADRQRLEAHMERMYELQRRLENRAAVSCGTVERPTRGAGFGRGLVELTRAPVDEARNAEWYQLYIDVIVAAFMCNVSSIATIYPGEPLVDGWNGNDWHERVAHAGDVANLSRHVSSVFRHVFLDLVRKLDVEEADGRTYLDNSWVQLTQESGFLTHFSLEMPLVTAGSAGGWFRTGRFVDYRFRESTLLPRRGWSGTKAEFREGLTWNQYMANVLMAMGVPRSEWRNGDRPGYGDLTIESYHSEAFHRGILDAADDPLPFLAA